MWGISLIYFYYRISTCYHWCYPQVSQEVQISFQTLGLNSQLLQFNLWLLVCSWLVNPVLYTYIYICIYICNCVYMDFYCPASVHVRICLYMYMCIHCLPEPLILLKIYLLLWPAQCVVLVNPIGPVLISWLPNLLVAFPSSSLGFPSVIGWSPFHMYPPVEEFLEGVPQCPILIP